MAVSRGIPRAANRPAAAQSRSGPKRNRSSAPLVSLQGDRKSAAPMRGSSEVDALLAQLRHPLTAELQAVRRIILGANRKFAERVKGNAPSFYYGADMAAFSLQDPRELRLIMVFPCGLVDDDGSGMLEGAWPDRRDIRFCGMADVEAKRETLVRVVNRWVDRMDGKR